MTEHLHCVPSARHSSCLYSESMARLDRHVDQIPMGWQTLFGDLRHGLRACAAKSRMNIRIDGAWEEYGLLRVESDTSDLVIQGLLRKARTRAMHTCSRCGGRGRRRELANWDEATLCGTCAAPRLLSLDIERVLALEKCGSLVLREELQQAPEALLIRAAAEAAATEHGLPKAFIVNQLNDEQLRAWLKYLRELIEERLMANQD